MKMRMVRQGDVLLVCVANNEADLEADLEPAPPDPRGIVLAEGETSGHHHAVFGRAKLMQYKQGNGARVLVVDREGAELRVVGGGLGGVDRHTPIMLAPGKWEVRIQRQWTAADELRSRQVAD